MKVLETLLNVVGIVAATFVIVLTWQQAQVTNDMRLAVSRFKATTERLDVIVKKHDGE